MASWIDTVFSQEMVSGVLSAVIILVIGILAARVVTVLLKKTLERSKLEKAAYSLILSLTKVVVYLLTGLAAASALGIDVTGIVALASVLTLALSLALQNMVSNVIGGFTILYTTPFHSGDYVEIAGQAGTVKEINMTYTMLTTPDNKLISIPNSSVVAAQVVNYSTMDTRRVDISVSCVYSVPTQKVIDALVLAATVDNVLLEPAPYAGVLTYGENAIGYALRFWVNNPDYWDVYFTVNQRIKQIFDEQGIEMGQPRMKVQLDK